MRGDCMDGWERLSDIIGKSEDGENRTIALCVFELKKDLEEIKNKVEMYKWVLGVIITMLVAIIGMLLKILDLVR